MSRYVAGTVAFAAAAAVLLWGYGSMPTASACAAINQAQRSIGGLATCSTTPPTTYFVVAGIMAFAGLLLWSPRILRWLAGK